MGYTRRQFVEAAFEEIGYATAVFDLGAEQLQSARRSLDRMMGEWNSRKIRLGYPIPANPDDSDLDDETDVPDSAWQAIVSNLALRIAPTVGKTPSDETKAAAQQGLENLLLLAQFKIGEKVYNSSVYTRRNLVEAAISELGMTAFIANMDESFFAEDARRLDRMMAEWNVKGIRLGYPLASKPALVDLDTPLYLPDAAWEAVVTNLALRIASYHGAQISADTRIAASRSYKTVLMRSVAPMTKQIRKVPRGAGNKPWRYGYVFTENEDTMLAAGPDSDLGFEA